MKRVFTIPILFFLSFLLIIYFILPSYFDFKSLRQEVSEKEIKVQEQKVYLSNLQEISENLEKETESESLEKIDFALPDKISFASLLNFFQEKVSESGLILKSLAQTKTSVFQLEEEEIPSRPKPKETYFNLNVGGTLPSFENFLNVIEKSSRIIEVESIFLKKETREEIIEFNLSLKVYSY